jgi:cell division protein FtsA
MVKQELDKAGIANKVPSGAIVTGGGAMTMGVEESAKRILSLPTRVSDPDGVRGLIDDIGDPRFSTVIGLILYGMAHYSEKKNTTSSLPANVKLPNMGSLTKLVDTIRDLLP